MKKIKYCILLVTVLLSISDLKAQTYKNFNVKLGKYTFSTKFDTSDYSTRLKIKKGPKTIFVGDSEFPITGITEYDLDNDGKKEILIDLYSGGAHCCNYLVAARIKNDKYITLDTIFWGNSFYEIKDLNNDGKYEIDGINDMFAYAFTNYAESRYSILIYGWQNDRFVNITNKFPDLIRKDIEELKTDLYSMTDTGFQCMNIGEDTFNTDAGAVKAILAPLADDYYMLGEMQTALNIIDSVYKCPDKDKFIEILRNDYKLK